MGDAQMETAQFGNVFFHESNFGNYTFFWGLKKREKKKRRKEDETKQKTTTRKTKSKTAHEISIRGYYL